MEQLGIEPLQIMLQVFNFLVMAAVLTYFLYKPILKILEERREKIKKGLADAEKIQVELAKTEAKRNEVIDAAKEKGRNIVEEAKKSAKLVEADIIVKAHDEAKVIIQKGKAEVETERADMEKKLRDETVTIAKAIAMRALEASLSVKMQRSIIDKKIRMVAKQLS